MNIQINSADNEALQEAKRIVNKFKRLLPGYIREVNLSIMANPSGENLYCTLQVHYTRLSISIGDFWMQQSVESRESDMLHELCHIYTTSATDLLDRTLKDILPENEYKILDRALERQTELSTDWLKHKFKELIEEIELLKQTAEPIL